MSLHEIGQRADLRGGLGLRCKLLDGQPPCEGVRQINPALATNHIQVIKDTHGKTSQLSQADLDALILYVTSLQ